MPPCVTDLQAGARWDSRPVALRLSWSRIDPPSVVRPSEIPEVGMENPGRKGTLHCSYRQDKVHARRRGYARSGTLPAPGAPRVAPARSPSATLTDCGAAKP